MLSARELDVEQLGDEAGRGPTSGSSTPTATGSPPCRSTRSRGQGTPDYLVSGINREPQLPVDEPRIYFGEETDTYVVTGDRHRRVRLPARHRRRAARGHDDRLERDDRRRHRQPVQPRPVRPALRRPEPAHQRPADRRLADPLPPRHRGAGAGDRSVPGLRPRPVPRQRGRIGSLWVWDAYTVTDRYPNAQPLGAESRVRRGQLRPQQRQGRGGRLRRHASASSSPTPTSRSSPPTRGSSPTCSSRSTRCRRSSRRTSAIRRTCSSRRTRRPGSTTCRRPTTGATTFYNQDDRWAIPEDVAAGNGAADGAVLRDHADPRRGRGRVRPDPAAGARGAPEHDRLGRGAHGSRRLRRAHRRSSFPTDTTTAGPGAGRGAHQPGRRDQRAVHALVERRLVASSAATCWCCRSAMTDCSTSSRSSSRRRARRSPSSCA